MTPHAAPRAHPATPHLVRVAFVLWVLVAVFVIVRGLLVHQPRHGGIFPVYATAGAAWVHGDPVYPAADGLDVFRYAPVYAAALAPVGLLPLTVGSVVWRTVLVLFLLTSVRVWLRDGLPRRPGRGFAAAVYLGLVPLVTWELLAAQANSLVLGMVLRAAAGANRGHWWRVSGWLAAAVLLKVYPVAFAAVLVVAHPRALGPRLPAAVLAGLALPFMLQHPAYVAAQYADWVRTVTADTGRAVLPTTLQYRDLGYLFKVWGRPLPAGVYQLVQVVAGLAIAVLAWRAARRGAATPARHLDLLGLSLVWMTVLGPCTEVVSYCLLGPVMAWAVCDAVVRRASRAYRLAVVGSSGLMAAAYLGFLFPFGGRFSNLGPHTLAGALFGLAWAARLAVTPAASRVPFVPRTLFAMLLSNRGGGPRATPSPEGRPR